MPFVDLERSIELTEAIDERLGGLPLVRQRIMLERAINAALDAEGEPAWYVVVNDKSGTVRGHVGPLPSDELATKVLASWQKSGHPASISRAPKGPPMTNVFA